jgi:5-methylcytosine-specific restriction endonuclease McrA
MLRKAKRIKLGKRAYRLLMKRILERDGWRCQNCGSVENLLVHHKIRRSQQGDDALRNLLTLCAYCHLEEHGQLCYSAAATEQVTGASWPSRSNLRARQERFQRQPMPIEQ